MRRLLLLALLAFPACAVASSPELFTFDPEPKYDPGTDMFARAGVTLPDSVSKDYAAGFCDAWALAVVASRDTVRHYQERLDSVANSDPTSYTGQTIKIIIDSLQSWVVLSGINNGGYVQLTPHDGNARRFKCMELNR